MKKLFCLLFAFCCLSTTYAQLGVNATGAAPLSSAQLDVSSTSKALYPPRMTTGQKNMIISPQPGAVVYDTSLGDLSFYNGSIWVSTTGSASSTIYTVGQNAQGGKVFWVDETGQHGLVMSTSDVSPGIVWTNGYSITKAYSNGAYGGAINTYLINQSLGNGPNATYVAIQHTGGNFGDWYLPTFNELGLMRSSGVSGIASGVYWTSNEYIVSTGQLPINAYNFDFSNGTGILSDKLNLHKVRAVRKF